MDNLLYSKTHTTASGSTMLKIIIVLSILLGLQLMNQILISSGSLLAKSLPVSEPIIYIGIFQQTIQAFLGIVLFRVIFKGGLRELGLRSKFTLFDLGHFSLFAAGWLVIIVLYVSMVHTYFPALWNSMRAIPLPASEAMLAKIVFQSIFPGLGEEILFRGLIVNLLASFVFPLHHTNPWHRFGIIALSSSYFAVAHIHFSISPFQILNFNVTQLAMAFGCGIFYAVVYLKTRSLLVPIMSHNFSNVTSTICGFLISGL